MHDFIIILNGIALLYNADKNFKIKKTGEL